MALHHRVVDNTLYDEMFPYFDTLAHKAKNLYNASLFRIRNAFTAHDKTSLTSNEKEVLDEEDVAIFSIV